jgi:hypothetical protein
MMGGKSWVKASEDEKRALVALSASRERAEADRLVPLLGALAIVAIRLLGLRDAARGDGAAPADVPQTTIKILAAKLQRPAEASLPTGTSCAASLGWAAFWPANPTANPVGRRSGRAGSSS